MKVICSRASLIDALSKVSRAVAPKSTIRAIEGIYIKATRENGLYLCGYNLDMGITCTIEAVVKDEGDVVVHPSKMFVDIIRRLPGDSVAISISMNNDIQVTSGTSTFVVSGMNGGDFPELPEFYAEKSVKIPNKVLRSMINQTIFSISDNMMHPIYTGVRFEVEEETARAIAIDGFRIAVRTEQVKNEYPCDFVVPGRTLSEVEKMLPDDDEDATISLAKRFILFQMGCYTVLSRALEGQFVDFRKVVKMVSEVEADVNVSRFIQAHERMGLMLSGGSNTSVRCFFGEGQVRLECRSEMGTANDSWEEEIDCDIHEIWFKNQYLLDAYRAADSDKVKITFGGSVDPIKIAPADGDSFEFYIMPCRQKKSNAQIE